MLNFFKVSKIKSLEKIVYFVSSAERRILTQERVTAPVRKNQLSARKTTPTQLNFRVRRTKKFFCDIDTLITSLYDFYFIYFFISWQ